MSSEARIWNIYPSVSFSAGNKGSIIVTESRMLNIVGRWSESRMSVTITSDSQMFWCTTIPKKSPLLSGV
jgi:hypothetical protein